MVYSSRVVSFILLQCNAGGTLLMRENDLSAGAGFATTTACRVKIREREGGSWGQHGSVANVGSDFRSLTQVVYFRHS